VLNGFRLGDVAEIEAQMFSFVQKFNRRTAVEFCTSARHITKPMLAVVFYRDSALPQFLLGKTARLVVYDKVPLFL
jgi:hypothetical protein